MKADSRNFGIVYNIELQFNPLTVKDDISRPGNLFSFYSPGPRGGYL